MNAIKKIFPILCYLLSAILSNRFGELLQVYQFNFPISITLISMITNLIILLILRFRTTSLQFPICDLNIARDAFPYAVCYVLITSILLHAVTLLWSRILCVLFTIVSEWILLGRKHNVLIIISVCIMSLGGILNAKDEFDSFTILFAIPHSLLTAACLVFSQTFQIDTPHLSSRTCGKMYYMFLNSIPILTILLINKMELSQLRDYEYFVDTNFVLFAICFITWSSVADYCTLWCMEVYSPLVIVVIAQVKNTISYEMYADDATPSMNGSYALLQWAGFLLYVLGEYKERYNSIRMPNSYPV